MELYLMREEPEGSGTYVEVDGRAIDGTAEDAVNLAVQKAAGGGRYALRVYESVRSEVQRQADMAATQAAAPTA
jgi:hypothetical protein